MPTKEECKCVGNMMDVLVMASGLANSAKKEYGPDIIKTDAQLLKEKVEKLEQNCATPVTHPKIGFFVEDRYVKAKSDLYKTIDSEGKNKYAAINAGDRFYSFITDNAARMIKCPEKR